MHPNNFWPGSDAIHFIGINQTVYGDDVIPVEVHSAFEIAVVRLLETTKTCAGQPKIMIWLSGRQPTISSQMLLFSMV